jgi:glycyl-tRNA synthetase beta chain
VVTKTFLLEICSEEIPAQYIAKMADSFKANAEKLLKEINLSFSSVRVVYSPRRLSLLVYGLTATQQDVVNEVKGPARVAAFVNGEPSRALLGFLSRYNLAPEDVTFKVIGNAEYCFITDTVKGKSATEVLKAQILPLIKSIYLPNAMRWGDYSFEFVRPIRSFTALFGDEPIAFETEFAKCTPFTRGHRTLSNKKIKITSADDYIKTLKKNSVIVEADERKALILKLIADYEAEKKVKVSVPEDLLHEVTNLVEFPTLIEGKFPKEFLYLPAPVITTPMETQQRYFPVFKGGKLTNSFIVIRDGGTESIDNVRHGNQRVLNARLSDAKFFYEDDKKTTLSEKAEKLNRVIFQEKVGSYAEKQQRVKAIADIVIKLSDGLSVKEYPQELSSVLKADLVSAVVKEFAEVQGIMGGIYAEDEGYPSEIAAAIGEQYLPVKAGGELPKTILGALTAIADKADTVFSLTAAGFTPTGSQDPYGLRRYIIGIAAIQKAFGLSFSLSLLLEKALPLYKNILGGTDEATYTASVCAFIKARLKAIIEEEFGVDYISELDDTLNICETTAKLNEIKTIESTAAYELFVQTRLRLQKISQNKESSGNFDPNLSICEDEEAAYAFGHPKFAKGYAEYVNSVQTLCSALNKFFDNNMVLCDDLTVKNNRLLYIKELLVQFNKI